MGKSKNGMLDTIIKNHNKDKKQAPNAYFKTEKSSQLEHRKFSTDAMFTTKRNLVSQLPKKSYIDDIFTTGKKHQVGPSTYKNLHSDHKTVDQRQMHGVFPNGLNKSTVPQHVMIDSSKAHATTRP